MDSNLDVFSGDVENIQLLVIDFLGNESVCENGSCDCGMDLPWAVIAEVGTDEYDPAADTEDEEETKSEVLARATSVEAALLSLREFESEYSQRWSVVLTDAAHYTFKVEAAFQEGLKTGNINWEDINFDTDSPPEPSDN